VRKLAKKICLAEVGDQASEKLMFIHYPSQIRLRNESFPSALNMDVSEGLDDFERLRVHKWIKLAKTLGISYHFACRM